MVQSGLKLGFIFLIRLVFFERISCVARRQGKFILGFGIIAIFCFIMKSSFINYYTNIKKREIKEFDE